MDGVITLVLQHFGNRHFLARQAHFREGHCVVRAIAIIIHWRQCAAIHVIGKHGHDFAHARRCRRELKSGPCRIASRHQHRTRRRTGAIAGIGLREQRTIGGQLVDVRCRHTATGDAATKRAEVINAEIIDKDEDDVRWALCSRLARHRRSLVPVDRTVRRDVRPARLRGHKEDDRLLVQEGDPACHHNNGKRAKNQFLQHVISLSRLLHECDNLAGKGVRCVFLQEMSAALNRHILDARYTGNE